MEPMEAKVLDVLSSPKLGACEYALCIEFFSFKMLFNDMPLTNLNYMEILHS